MNGKTTLGLVFILAALGGYVYIFEIGNDFRQTDDGLTEIFGNNYGEYDVVELEISNSHHTAHFVRTNTSFTRDWAMAQPTALPAHALDQVQVNGTATRLGQLTASQVIANVTDWGQYGLASPELTVTLTISNGQKLVLFTGNPTPVDDNRYIRTSTDHHSVYLVFGFTVDALRNLLNELPLAPTPLPTAEENN